MNFGWSQVQEARARIAPVLYSGFGPSYTPEADIRERPLRISGPRDQAADSLSRVDGPVALLSGYQAIMPSVRATSPRSRGFASRACGCTPTPEDSSRYAHGRGFGSGMPGPRPELDRPKLMFHGLSPYSQDVGLVIQPVLHGLENGRVFPALASPVVAGRALGPQRAAGPRG